MKLSLSATSRAKRLQAAAFGGLALGLAIVAPVAGARPDEQHGPQVHIPEVHGVTFSDAKVDLPEAFRGKVGILVVGFSQGSRDGVTVWGKRLAGDYFDSSSVAYYEMPVLASVPKLLRGFVEGRIKASVSDRGRPHFLPLLDNETEWRSLVHYGNADDPYLLVVDERGVIRWQTQGAPTDAAYGLLKQQVEAIRPR